jgi:YidC/Oxa1 family membrane protein insertase
MDKRLGLALAISMVILFGWWKLFPPPQTPPPQTPAQQASAPAPSEPAPATPGGPPGSTAPGAPANAAEQRVTLDSADPSGATFVLSSWGGTLREVHLKERKFRDVQIIQTTTPETAPLLTTFVSSDFSLAGATPYAVSQPAPNAVVFTAEINGVVIEKSYSLEPGRFRLHLDVTVRNKREKPITQSLRLHLFGHQDPEKKGGSFLSYASANLTEMVCYWGGDDKVERNNIDTLLKGEKTLVGTINWIAADEKFFTVAAVNWPDNLAQSQKCVQRALDPLTGEVLIPFSNRTIAAGEKTTYSFTAFGGPKYREELEAVKPGGQETHLVKVINVTFAWLSAPLLHLLKFIYGFTHNWGLAIILLTLVVRMVTFYPQQRTMMSAKKMQRLAPKLAAIRKKYGEDKQRIGVETMSLYKAHGVSPLGGCLPALIQMPIWMALFSTLNYSVELHRSGFLGYIADLSAKDPFYVTPLLMGGVMFLQMRMSPAGADPQQQKMMAVMMPIMFTVFSLFLPAGLAIYTLTSYLIGILQQLLVNYLDRRRERGSAPAKA